MNVFELSAVLNLDTSDYEKGLDQAASQGQSFATNTGSKFSAFGDILKANLISAAVEKGMALLISGMKQIGNAIEANMGTAVARLDTLNSYGKTMEALGFSIEDATAAQAKLSDAIDGLPTTLDGIISWQQQFTALSDDIEGSTDLTIALNNATLAAGKGQEAANNAMGNWYAILAAGAPDMQHWQSIYSTMPAQMNQLAEAMLGAGAKSDDLYAAWKDGAVTAEDVKAALISLNSEGLDGVASFADQAQIGAQTIATAYGNINTAIGKNIAKVLDVINGDTAEGGGRIVELLLNVKNLINDIGTAVANFVSEHEPQITAIMDAMNAILGGGDITSNLKKIKDNVKPIISDVLTAAAKALPEIMSFAANVIEVLLSALLENAPAIIDAALAIITNLVTTLSDPTALVQFTNTAVTLVTALVNGISMALPVIVPAVLQIVTTIIQTLTTPENIGQLLNAALLLLGAIVMALAQSVPVYIDYIFNMLDNMENLFLAAVDWVAFSLIPSILGLWDQYIAPWLNNGLASIGQWWINIQNTMLLALTAIGTGLSIWFTDQINNITGWFTGIGDSVSEWFNAQIAGITEFGTNAWNGVQDMINNIGATIQGAIDSALNWGSDLIDNFVQGIKNAWGSFTGVIDDLAQYIADNVGFSEPKEGVLSNFHTYAPDMIDLFAEGLYSSKGVLQGAFADVLQLPSINDGIQPALAASSMNMQSNQAANNQTIIIPVYIGNEKIDEIVIKSNQRNDYISGGR